MKHFWIGLSILALLLALSIGSLLFMSVTTEKVAALLDEAQSLKPEAAMEKVSQAEDLWNRRYGLMAALTDHEGLNEIRQGFAELKTCPQDFETRCCGLASLVRGLSQSEMPYYYNFL